MSEKPKTRTKQVAAKKSESLVTLRFTGDGFLDVPGLGVYGLGNGHKLKADKEAAQQLLADPTVSVELVELVGGSKA